MSYLQFFNGLRGISKTVFVTLLLALTLGLIACEKEGPAEKAGEKVDEAVEKMGDQLEKAGDKMEEATDKVNQ